MDDKEQRTMWTMCTQALVAGAILASADGPRVFERLEVNFGSTPGEAGWLVVSSRDVFTPQRGCGWVGASRPADRDRERPDVLRRSFVFGRKPATFRVALKPGLYRLEIIAGDMEYGDHALRLSVGDRGPKLPLMRSRIGEFVTLAATVDVPTSPLEVHFDSPRGNWVVNALVLEPTTARQAPKLTKQRFAIKPKDTWAADVAKWPDPTAPHLERFRAELAKRPRPEPTGLSRGDYLKLIEGNVDYFKQHQDADGAIIDPYMEKEWQYSTPCFALAAATVVAHKGRDDLLEPAARAMDWATACLPRGQAATGHADFYPPQVSHALPLLEPRVKPERARRWRADLRAIDPWDIYRSTPGGGNWNVVALSGEYLFRRLGLRDDTTYIEGCVKAQGRHFGSPWGLYCEGPMPYDLFPRIWAADMMAAGYDGARAAELREVLRRGAMTSLLVQSPCGELPAGGRSAHHQWNEAQQCMLFEIYAAGAKAHGDATVAGVFKRAARKALGSVGRWVRPTGELQIVKNRVDPARRHGYEGYSGHSQYNLLAMAMLAIAFEHAETTDDVPEQWAPSDVGGFVVELDKPHGKVIANAGGGYVELNTGVLFQYNPLGLIRVHFAGGNPQLGPSDGLVEHPKYQVPREHRTTAAVGCAWRDAKGAWVRLADAKRAGLKDVLLSDVHEAPDDVRFVVTYRLATAGPSAVTERYRITPRQVLVEFRVHDYAGPTRVVWPVLADDGADKTEIVRTGTQVTVTHGGKSQTFTSPTGADVTVGTEVHPCRNGWARLAVAEHAAGDAMSLRIALGPGERERHSDE